MYVIGNVIKMKNVKLIEEGVKVSMDYKDVHN